VGAVGPKTNNISLFSFKLFHGSEILCVFGGDGTTVLYLYQRRPLGSSTRADYRLVTDRTDARYCVQSPQFVLDFVAGKNSRYDRN
jgi:hypothetical protein